MKIDLKNLTIQKASDHMKRGDFGALDLAEQYVKVIADNNAGINCYLEMFDDIGDQAKAAQKMIDDGTATLLTGIPIAVKDNILIKGRKAGAASKILEGFVSPYDATVISKLKKEGVVFLGRTNMDEFAMGASTENSAYGPTRNPCDESRVPGGSSGGSAAAVAMDGALAALGSDTGGSVRQPASFCGVVGLKPTYGSVSRFGLIAMGSSLDQIGSMGKTVEDVKILYDAMRGYDTKDSSTLPDYDPYSLRGKAEGLTIGVPWHFMRNGGIDPDVLENFESSIKLLESIGYKTKEISLPNIKYSLAIYYILMPAESSSNLARFDGVKYGLMEEGSDLLQTYINSRTVGFGPEPRRRIMLGNYILSAGYYDAYYNKANALRALINKDFDDAFREVDALVTPTTPSPAFKIGDKTGDPLSMYLEDIFTVPANLTGVPAISVPSGKVTREGKELPLGLEIMARRKEEGVLFKIGKDFQSASLR
ncbi:MAG: glutaminyl-tRNA synthase (glutamine-hydrolyzing) subunit A [Candidatus Taylorbacteria bacterium RIFCSPLOWO2_12_FULL_43_20]|uniref:Glutamyl-tRNA(Gln) amidotransferase subunit A n=1 Tax=Candidatus Taylorbacteria bacterium RIFCSPLOWO2_12_FULL_43_20 TaxID=1802332 RepID=A0A1G2P1U3_9BACT|nr:MAG: glutaminyl-tRNA synthase (glutamine-hydrolyzing) subunit A [Candidatus Taylorbacteria bacterium RIFCSPHIGHO2_01_FULL_43_120]OHA22832.1 MAG: glutaminyl-tRNA synthase (glutamine-hydrolyzing) subunit A [Candidatus Taylorbacteria bacterium RIFCSPHIGHO2_02_FULL_43_55]OHA29387.1 MAG: glutaminyl-tRNA synthase (glutamine-hydrolyzing) subunit A [Candidatus Taylorbacteria bacterium RIFCSPHIGHO2_12_FULL_42_34]OHA31763.1 MAG: glutaminyl-tRNA synthase (glutamine-hydrolyzing) subunit A [Candidatus Tay